MLYLHRQARLHESGSRIPRTSLKRSTALPPLLLPRSNHFVSCTLQSLPHVNPNGSHLIRDQVQLMTLRPNSHQPRQRPPPALPRTYENTDPRSHPRRDAPGRQVVRISSGISLTRAFKTPCPSFTRCRPRPTTLTLLHAHSICREIPVAVPPECARDLPIHHAKQLY